jgi:dTDP-4-dehydrorhamnose 3,5-epimerase
MEPRLLNGGIAVDDRGSVSFVNDFDFLGVKRFYCVENHRSGFIRAWHGHMMEAKYVYVAKGTALVGAVKLSKDNDNIPQPQRFVLSEKSPKVLYIPAGYANGFKTLEEGTKIMFFSTKTLQESLGDDIRFPHNTWDIWSEDFR